MARFLAIDWAQQQLHVVAADIHRGTVTFHRAAVWHEEQSPEVANAEELGRLLRERLKEAGIAPAPVLACIGRDRVILKDVRFPAVPDAEEPAIVRFQAVKELTDPPDEVVLDYTLLSNGDGERRALVLALRRELLAAYQKLCQVAGLKLAGLTPRPFGLAVSAPPASADVPRAIVAAGESWAEFCIVRGSTLLLTRSLTPGSGLAAEIRRNLTLFSGQSSGQRVEEVYVAGATDNALFQRLSETLDDISTRAFDPFGQASGEMLPSGERGSFAASVGLLLAKARPQGLPVNFVQPRQPAPPKRISPLLVAAVVAATLLLLGSGIVATRSYLTARIDEKEELENQRDELDTQLNNAHELSRRLQALDAWEVPVWLDELYDLATRIRDINALQVTELKAEPLSHTAKSRYAACYHIRGTLRDDRGPLDQLVTALRRDGHYGLEAPKVSGNHFDLTVNVERRPPGLYKQQLSKGGER